MGVTYEPDDGTTTAPTPHCPECEFLQDRYETGHGRYILLEFRRELPSYDVPAGQRWLIRSDGKAVNTGEAELPATTRCRFPHRIVCPCSNPPSGTTLRALWEYNSGVAPRLDPPAAEAG
ncbi:DUF6083 domain-containing protein [Streptomyces sp. NPDC046215]|uniref:Uncharacterized protein n=1 Tax=Streptomyces stramineus TaxID=173861 RepID=A0ABN0ZVT5_9ACTN